MSKMQRLLLAVSLVAVVAFVGCEKTPPAEQDHSGHEHAMAAKEVTAQTMCPIMDGPINKDIFVEYEGKKVYFCCPGCQAPFLKDPEKYISKLPQFKE